MERLRLRSSPSLIFATCAHDLEAARRKLYAELERIVPENLIFRRDIGNVANGQLDDTTPRPVIR